MQIYKNKSDLYLAPVLVAGAVLISWFFITTEPTPQIQTSPLSVDEYGSSLTECLQKADIWLAEAKQTAKNVLAEEKMRKNTYQDFIDQHASSEDEIMTTLQVEWVDYKKECNKYF